MNIEVRRASKMCSSIIDRRVIFEFQLCISLKKAMASKFQPVKMSDDRSDEHVDSMCSLDLRIERGGQSDAAHYDDEDERFGRLERDSNSNCSLPLLSDGDELKRYFDAQSPGLPWRCRSSGTIILICIAVLAACAARDGSIPKFIFLGDSSQVQPMKDEETTATESPSKAVHVVYSSDDESLAGVEASIKSVVDHASGPVAFHYVGNTPLPPIPGADVHFKDLSRMARRYHLDEYMNPTFERGHGMTGLNTNPANFVRFAIHEFLPSQSKAVWIDADTLISCDVVNLVNSILNDEENVIAAVPREGPLHGLTKEGDRIFADISISFNAGFYCINLDNWRRQKISEKVKEVALKNRETFMYKNGSQPPMAIAIGERFEHLPPTWNVAMSDVEELTDEWLEETCMMHWNGPFKPWDASAKKHYYLDLWLQYGTQVERKHQEHNHHKHKHDQGDVDADENKKHDKNLPLLT